MLERARNDLDVLENTLASVTASGSLPAIDSLIREARMLIDLLQSEYQNLTLDEPPVRLGAPGHETT